MKKFTAFIFDFDGVTVNTEAIFASFDCGEINTVLEKADISERLPPSDMRKLAGMASRDKLLAVGKMLRCDMRPYIEEFTAERNKKRQTLFAENKVHLGKNIREFIDKIGKENCALSTNKRLYKLENDLAIMEIADIYSTVVTSDPPMRRKPEPDIIIEAMKLLNVQPDECAYIGDNMNDMIASKAANVTPIGFTIEGLVNEPKRAQMLKENGAMIVIDDFMDLIPYIK
ncbi:MAG: HAD-IA family hydrolase [Alphaproteobacteria bacterium]|nr:HAD-IA family hydrolase [Alphaproteobacteria bacterium]